MNYLPKIQKRDDGRVELFTVITLPNGRFLRDAINFDSKNLLFIAESLEKYVDSRKPSQTYSQGDDIITFRFGGTDYNPKLIIFNQREKGGSICISFNSASDIIKILRDASH